MTVLHERQILREAIVAALTGETEADDRVLKSRFEPKKLDQLPLLCVFNAEEPIKEGSEKSAPRELERLYRVTIVGWVIATDDVDDVLDALSLEIETAMDADTTFDLNARESFLTTTEFGIDLKGERPLGAVSMTYACTYRTGPRVAAPADNFDKANSAISIANDQAVDDRAKDDVTGIYAP